MQADDSEPAGMEGSGMAMMRHALTGTVRALTLIGLAGASSMAVAQSEVTDVFPASSAHSVHASRTVETVPVQKVEPARAPRKARVSMRFSGDATPSAVSKVATGKAAKPSKRSTPGKSAVRHRRKLRLKPLPGSVRTYAAAPGQRGGMRPPAHPASVIRSQPRADAARPVTIEKVFRAVSLAEIHGNDENGSVDVPANDQAKPGSGSDSLESNSEAQNAANLSPPATLNGIAAHASASQAAAQATAPNSLAIGNDALASGARSSALGNGAMASAANSVALGADSLADRENTVSVGSANHERQITNIAPGTAPTDGVNLGQLNNAIGGVNSRIDDVDRVARRGIASAAALNIVTPYLPGRTTLNAGMASYRGQSALGIGLSRWNQKGTVNYNLGVSTAGGNSTIVRVGIGIVLRA
ncbi:YadA-like family protein [Caballeronia sp. LZ065]|uniref:YadA-like family protein n=1 Tax=Caballeronia sp. LZ065 TaxID=3038571 RepID=UPI00286AB96F|nr:YadA-like family protein [Caballeronia sp. LZ065]